ncbi:MAG: ATP-binding protein, partial [Actinobacteria bacterium]|nr:ATP-binding protein [Actinomycetota bacterium]
KVFENFEQLSKGDAREGSGIGLGLPIARRLARAMGGDVWYERRFPTGSRFCYSLPLRRRVFVSGGERHGVPESESESVVELPEAVHTN